MKWFKKFILLFVLLSFGAIMTGCVGPNSGRYKEDIDKNGRYKGEKSYDEMLDWYTFLNDINAEGIKNCKNTMLAVGLCKYYHLETMIDKFSSNYNILKDKDLNAIGEYLGITDVGFRKLDYTFSYYFSPDNHDVFSILKLYIDHKVVGCYYFPSYYVSDRLWSFNSFDRYLYTKIFSDGYLIIDGTDFGLHLNGKVIPRYIQDLGGRFYPYLYLYDFLYNLKFYDISELSFVREDASVKNVNYLRYYALTNRHFNQIYFNLDDLLNNRKKIYGIIAISHYSASDFSDKSLPKSNLDDVFSFTLDVSDGVKNCKLKQLSLYN